MIRGIIFDINGTLIDILTDEYDHAVWRTTANFLDYHGVRIDPDRLRARYTELNRKQRKESPEKYPEFDVSAIFRTVISEFRTEPVKHPRLLADAASRVFRAASRRQLIPYPGVPEVMEQLKERFLLAAVSDGQVLWAYPELRSTGLEQYFSCILISGDFGFRKPDLRLFETVLDQLNLAAEEAMFVGNDMFRDIYGAHEAGMKTVFFKSNQGDWKPHGAEPDYVIYSFGELPRAIDYFQGR